MVFCLLRRENIGIRAANELIFPESGPLPEALVQEQESALVVFEEYGDREPVEGPLDLADQEAGLAFAAFRQQAPVQTGERGQQDQNYSPRDKLECQNSFLPL